MLIQRAGGEDKGASRHSAQILNPGNTASEKSEQRSAISAAKMIETKLLTSL